MWALRPRSLMASDSAVIVWPSDVESTANNYWVAVNVADNGGIFRSSGTFQDLNAPSEHDNGPGGYRHL